MELLQEWVNFLFKKQKPEIKLSSNGTFKAQDNHPVIREVLGPFLWKTNYITQEEYSLIKKHWSSLEELKDLLKLLVTYQLKPEKKIKLRIDFKGELENVMYVGRIMGQGEVLVDEMVIPLNLITDDLFVAELDKGYQKEIEGLEKLPIYLPKEYNYRFKDKVIYLNNPILVNYDNKGHYVGNCMVREDSLLCQIGERFIYWDKLNGQIEFTKKDMGIMIDVITSFFKLPTTKTPISQMIFNINFKELEKEYMFD